MAGEVKRIIFSTFFAMLMVSMIFQNVAAEIPTYTVDDDGSNLVIAVGQRFNVSVYWSSVMRWLLDGYDLFGDGDYDSTVLEIVDGGFWQPVDEVWPTFNLTFEGISAGNETIIYNYCWLSNNSIEDFFTLNVTVIESDQSLNPMLMVIVVIIIAVVPSVIIIKWMKGGKNNEN